MIRRRHLLAASAGVAAGALAAPAVLRAQEVKALTFYYPIAVGGPLQAIMDGYCADFAKETGITVNPVYSGDYSQTLDDGGSQVSLGVWPVPVAWAAGDWKLLPDEPGASYSSLRAQPGSAQAAAEGWQVLEPASAAG